MQKPKVAYLWQIGIVFFSAALTTQNSPELKIHIRNVTQDTSVNYSVAYTMQRLVGLAMLFLTIANSCKFIEDFQHNLSKILIINNTIFLKACIYVRIEDCKL